MFSHLNEGNIILVSKEALSELFKESSFKKSFSLQLKQFLPSKRWYSAKDDKIKSVEIETVVPLQDKADTHYIVMRVFLAGGDDPLFAMPLRIILGDKAQNQLENNPGSVVSIVAASEVKRGVIYDAAGDDDFSAGILEYLFNDKSVDLGNGYFLTGSATSTGKENISEVDGMPQKMLGVEQSNTSLIVGKKIMLKMYRRVAFGSHPEVATTAFLTEEAGFKNTPPYLGKLELTQKNGEPLALGILQGFVPNEGDGWSYTMNYLKGFFEKAENLHVTKAFHEEYAKTAHLLGQRTAEMHKAFAMGTGPVFEPALIMSGDLIDWRVQVIAQADRTIAAVEANLNNATGDIRKKAENLIQRRDIIVERINSLVPDNVEANKTRFHGDYHLGQIVIADGDFYILDFEGEPLRPITERQIRHCVLKDVAGMVRSFDYAAFGAVLTFVPPEKRSLFLPMAADWQKQATDAFLAGYFENMHGCLSLPFDKETSQKLLDLFVLEKALYEVIYEVANRPDWLAIPMNGLARLIDLDGE